MNNIPTSNLEPRTLVHHHTLRIVDRGIEWALMGIACAVAVADLNHVLEYLFLSLALIIVARKLASGDRRLARTSLDVPIILLLGWILLSVAMATDREYSFHEWRKFLAHVVMFFLIVNFVSEERQVKRILAAFVVGVCVMSVYGIGEFFAAHGSLIDQWHLRTIRAGSLTSEYNWFSTYLLMGIPIVAAFGLSSTNRSWKAFCVLTMGVALFALVLTYTRSAWIAVLVQALLFGLLKNWKITSAVTGVIAAGLLIGVLKTTIIIPPEPGATTGTAVELEGSTAHSGTLICRLYLWRAGLRDVAAQPLFGWGYGRNTFAQRYQDVQFPECPPRLEHIHNSYLGLAFGAGIPALMLFLWMLFRIGTFLWSGLRTARSEFQRNLALGVLLMTVGLAIRLWFDQMFVGMLAVLFWMLVGLSFALHHHAGRPILSPSAIHTS